MSKGPNYTPRDCGARLVAIRAALRVLDDATGKLSIAWDAEILRTSPHLADCCMRVPAASSEAELVAAQDAWKAAHAALAIEVARPVPCCPTNSPGPGCNAFKREYERGSSGRCIHCDHEWSCHASSELPVHVPHGARARAREEGQS